MAQLRVVQIAQPGGPLELVERDLPAPSVGQVRVKVEVCPLEQAVAAYERMMSGAARFRVVLTTGQ